MHVGQSGRVFLESLRPATRRAGHGCDRDRTGRCSRGDGGGDQRLAVLSPLVLTADLVLLLRSEVVLNVEGFADLLGGLALDHVGDRLAANVEERLDVHVVGGEDDLEEHLLVDLHELLVPLFDVGGLLARVGVVVLGRGGVVLVLGAPLEDLLENVLGDLEEEY